MDDWSFPCGLKINGKALLILAIDYQVIGRITLTTGLGVNGKFSIQNNHQCTIASPLLLPPSQLKRACLQRVSTQVGQAGIRLRGKLKGTESLFVRQTDHSFLHLFISFDRYLGTKNQPISKYRVVECRLNLQTLTWKPSS